MFLIFSEIFICLYRTHVILFIFAFPQFGRIIYENASL